MCKCIPCKQQSGETQIYVTSSQLEANMLLKYSTLETKIHRWQWYKSPSSDSKMRSLSSSNSSLSNERRSDSGRKLSSLLSLIFTSSSLKCVKYWCQLLPIKFWCKRQASNIGRFFSPWQLASPPVYSLKIESMIALITQGLNLLSY